MCLPFSAFRKQVATYAKENEELRNQADALKEEVATLSERQEGAGNSGQPSRKTSDQAEDETMDVSAEHDGGTRESTSKSGTSARISREDESRLREENEDLSLQVKVLRTRVGELTEEAHSLKKEKKSLKKQWESDFERLESNLKQRWEKERHRLIADNEGMTSRCEWNQFTLAHLSIIAEPEATSTYAAGQLEKELAFEVEQSKKLQALASQSAASQSKATPSIPSTTASTSSPADSEELVQLLLDFTGMTLVRRPQEGDKTYNFVMTDTKKRKALNFKLIVDRENASVDFIPDLLPGRDDEVIDCMEQAIRGHIKFEYDLIQTFFKRVSQLLALVHESNEADLLLSTVMESFEWSQVMSQDLSRHQMKEGCYK